jgi:hypothetical protein
MRILKPIFTALPPIKARSKGDFYILCKDLGATRVVVDVLANDLPSKEDGAEPPRRGYVGVMKSRGLDGRRIEARFQVATYEDLQFRPDPKEAQRAESQAYIWVLNTRQELKKLGLEIPGFIEVVLTWMECNLVFRKRKSEQGAAVYQERVVILN